MAISRKSRNEQSDDQIFETPIAQIFNDVDNEDHPEEKQDDKYDALAKQMADLQSRLSEAERTNMALLQSPNQWKSQVDQVVEVKPESIPLPDPALDPEGFDRASGQRTELRLANAERRRQAELNQRQETSEKVNELWSDFAEAYPDISENKKRVDFVATSVVQAAQKRGIDVQRYMFVNRDRFMSDVVKEYENIFGKADASDDDYQDDPPARRSSSRAAPRNQSRRRDRAEEDDNRTGGIFGGNESGNRTSSNRSREDETGGSMIDDIQAIQKKTGFF